MGDVRTALLDARTALEKAEAVGDPALLAVTIARVGQVETYAAEITPGLLERGAEIEAQLGLWLEYLESPGVALARRLMRQGELDRVRAVFEEREAKAAARGDEGTRTFLLFSLCTLEWCAGRWQRALEYGQAAYELAEQAHDGQMLTNVGRFTGLVQVDLGRVDEARASAEKGLASSHGLLNELVQTATLGVLGRLELALGNLDAAGSYLRDLPGRLLAAGINDPTATAWADAIETLVALGELDQARDYLELYELHASQVGSPFAVAAAARCRGLLAAANGDVPEAFAAFAAALEGLDRLPFPLERARTLLCLGVVRRQAQQKRGAREALEQALVIFEELGARLWAERAKAELRRISGRRAPTEELTETEQRVAVLASQGRSNREIASELFMGVSTVESHLSRVYRKLGIRSRAELGSRLTTPRDETANGVGEATQV
jgi:ATP/maltotriose-dependent transcriptional regulator MalT